jgi:hypothetical protein
MPPTTRRTSARSRPWNAFLEDRRLFAFAMKAHGLEDMTYAKAFMRKVLESDLDDEQSFVRRLVDTRYIEFARAFSFGTDGGVRQNLPFAQNEYQVDDTVGLYSEPRVKQGISAAAEAKYFQSKIPTLSSVDELIGDKRLFAYALTAFGIESRYASAAPFAISSRAICPTRPAPANQMGLRYRASPPLSLRHGRQRDRWVRRPDGRAARGTVYLNYEEFRQQGDRRGGCPQDAILQQQHRRGGLGRRPARQRQAVRLRATAFGINPTPHRKPRSGKCW